MNLSSRVGEDNFVKTKLPVTSAKIILAETWADLSENFIEQLHLQQFLSSSSASNRHYFEFIL